MSDKREYRLVTGGEDGMIMWWNFSAAINQVTSSDPNLKAPMVVHVKL